MQKIVGATLVALFLFQSAQAETTPAPGYIYSRQVLSELTEGCVAQAPGGVFVAVGPPLAFPTPSAGTRSILFVTESGVPHTVATGLNSIADCVYDAAADVLYVTDSGLEFSGATTGDTVFAIPGDSTAVDVDGLEVLPSGSIPAAFSIDILAGNLLVSDATGGGGGSVIAIDLSTMTPSTFASGFDYTGGLVADGSRVLVSEALDPSFESAIHSYSTAGAFQSTISGPTYGHGTIDLAIARDGGILATGSPTLVSIDDVATVTPLVTGLDGGGMFDAFGGGIAASAFTGRIDFLASTFSGADDDKSVHRLVPVDRLVTGGGNAATDCAVELYGLELVPVAEGRPAKSAICVDGASCDADGAADGSCTFPLGICINVIDARLPDCTPSGVASIELVNAKPDSEAVTILAGDVAAALPSADATCFFSDGVVVPLRTTSGGEMRRGRGSVRIRAFTDQVPPHKDTDVARLVCEPAP